MNLIKLLLVSEILSDDDPIVKYRLEKYSLKNRWKRALKNPHWWYLVAFLAAMVGAFFLAGKM